MTFCDKADKPETIKSKFEKNFILLNQLLINNSNESTVCEFFFSQERFIELFLYKIGTNESKIDSATSIWNYGELLSNEPNIYFLWNKNDEIKLTLSLLNKTKTFFGKHILKLDKYKTINIYEFNIYIKTKFVMLCCSYFDFLLKFQKSSIKLNSKTYNNTLDASLFLFNSIKIMFELINNYSTHHSKIYINCLDKLLHSYGDKALSDLILYEYRDKLSTYSKKRYNFELSES